MLVLRTARRNRTIPLGGDDDIMSLQTLEKHRRIGDMRRRLTIRMSMPSKNLLKAVGLGSLPAIAIGAAAYPAITSDAFRSPEVAAGMFIVTAGALLLGHYFTNQRLTGKDRRVRPKVIGYADALIIGFAQAAALIPGISRSAATITDRTRPRHAVGRGSEIFISLVGTRDRHRFDRLVRSGPRLAVRILTRLGRTGNRFRGIVHRVLRSHQRVYVVDTAVGDVNAVAVRGVYSGDRGDMCWWCSTGSDGAQYTK